VAFGLPFSLPREMATQPITANSHDPSLFERARSGDSDAFVALASTCDAAVYRVALRITRNPADAEDVRQQTLMKAFANFNQFRDGFRFAAWITQIAANESVSLLRRRRDSRWVSLEEMTTDHDGVRLMREPRSKRENPEQSCARLELRNRLIEELRRLNPSLRSVCLLRDVNNLSTEETADQLGLTPQAVRTRLFRGRLKLREHLRGLLKPQQNETRSALPEAACGD
jgi:RNA polymerase sigma-70 factor (ECF subfamily)